MNNFPPPPEMKPGGYPPPRRRSQSRQMPNDTSAFGTHLTSPSAPRRTTLERRSAKQKRCPIFTGQQWVCLACLCLAFSVCLTFYLVYENKYDALIEERINTENRHQRMVKRDRDKYREWIEYYAAVNNIDPAFAAAIIKRESDFDPNALSSAGARGLMQIMPKNTQWLAGKVNVYDDNPDILYDPETNIKMGCWYLGYLSRMFGGDLVTVACGYHAGQGNVRDHWLKKYSSNGKTLTLAEIPYDDTKYYARKVLETYAIYKQHHY